MLSTFKLQQETGETSNGLIHLLSVDPRVFGIGQFEPNIVGPFTFWVGKDVVLIGKEHI